MKKILFFATALLALASCTSNDFVGNEDVGKANTDAPLSFSFNMPAPTRGTSADAGLLSNQFVVWGEKSETNAAAATGNLVFKNYLVKYAENTAFTTTSNTRNWEYVGITATADENTNIEPDAGTTAQTIKYWDYSATKYTFTAVSALPTDISSGKVKITKTESGTTVYDKGYTIEVTDAADLDHLYFADRVEIAKSTNDDRTQENLYGGIVKFTFRNAISKVRVGMFETIPGYDVKIDKFYYDNRTDPTFAQMGSPNTTNFVANVPNYAPASGKTSVAGTFTVKYFEKNTTNDAAGISNHATISFAGSGTTNPYLTLGTNINSATKLAETTAQPTWDTEGGTFSTVFPQEANTTNLKLKVDYTLSNSISGETITVTGATAEIPAQYLQWKPNFKYTYIFKISDNTNGTTGSSGDPAGLYPITFDAVLIAAEDGNTEYITTVSEPSITTYAKGSAVTTNGEYAAGEKIYTVVEDNSGLATLSATNMKLYTVTTSDATNFPISEASVAEAIAEYPCLTTEGRTNAKIKFTESSFTYGKTVIDSNGSTITMDEDNNVVADFTTAAGTTYAIQYIKSAVTYEVDEGKEYTETEYNAAGTLYTDAAGTTEATSWTSGTKYYKRIGVNDVGVYAYKIVKVKASGSK